MTEETADDLVQKYLKLKDWVDAETKRFASHIEPYRHEMEAITNQLNAVLIAQKAESLKTEHGTAYISTIMNLKITDREKYLDFVNDEWDAFGAEMLMASAQKDSVKNYMDAHAGKAPPGIEIGFLKRVNIRRS